MTVTPLGTKRFGRLANGGLYWTVITTLVASFS